MGGRSVQKHNENENVTCIRVNKVVQSLGKSEERKQITWTLVKIT
jgi:hypothetical protein